MCTSGLLLAGPAAADDPTAATLPMPVVGDVCEVGGPLPDPFTCELQKIVLMPGKTAPPTVVPTKAPPATKAPTTSRPPVAPAAGSSEPAVPSQDAARANRARAVPPPVAPAPRPAPPVASLPIAPMPAPAANLTGQRVAAAPISGAATPLPPITAMPPVQALAAVQDPLLAVGDEAASGGGGPLAPMTGAALPGLLVVLGTAVVAAVGVGNVRAWQLRQVAVRQLPVRLRRR